MRGCGELRRQLLVRRSVHNAGMSRNSATPTSTLNAQLSSHVTTHSKADGLRLAKDSSQEGQNEPWI